MAKNKNINILLKLTDKFSDPLKNATKEVKDQQKAIKRANTVITDWANKSNKRFKSVMGTVGKLGAAVLTLGGALSAAGLKSFADESMELAKVQVRSETMLESALSNVSSIADKGSAAVRRAKAELMDYASGIQQVGVIGDEVTLSGMQQLATFDMDTTQIEALSGVMADLLAKKYGLDSTAENATSVATALGKAMTGSTGALAKMGVVLTDDEKKLLAVADGAQRAANLAKILESRVGGANAALAATDQGKIQQAANLWGDLKEEIGKKLLAVKAHMAGLFVDYLPTMQTQLLTFTDVVVAKLQEMADWVAAHKDSIAAALTSIGKTASAVLGFVINHWQGLAKVGGVALGVFGGMSVISGTTKRVKDFSDSIKTLKKGFSAFKKLTGVTPMFAAFKTGISGVAKAFKFLWGVLRAHPLGIIITVIGILLPLFLSLYHNNETFRNGINRLWSSIKSAFGNIKNAASDLKDKFVSAFTTLQTKISSIADKIKEFLQPIADIISAIKSGLSGLGFGSITSYRDTSYRDRGYALGTPFFSGGLATINEGGRGEKVILPSGTQIIPHDVATKQGGGTNVTVNVTVQGNVIGNRDFMEQTGAYISHRIIAALGVV